MNGTIPPGTAALPELRTARLLLRGWTPSDREPFARLAADPDVRRYFPSRLSREEADAMCDRMQTRIANDGFGFWVAELPGELPFAGIIGLQWLDFLSPAPQLEIGWWLDPVCWGRGLATEGALAVRDFAFRIVGVDHLVSVTATQNLPSQRVMQRLGMRTNPAENFPHPRVPADSPLSEHVLYRIDRVAWQQLIQESST